jgi:hypothetical protein
MSRRKHLPPRGGSDLPRRIIDAPTWVRQYLEHHGPTPVNDVLRAGLLHGFAVRIFIKPPPRCPWRTCPVALVRRAGIGG